LFSHLSGNFAEYGISFRNAVELYIENAQACPLLRGGGTSTGEYNARVLGLRSNSTGSGPPDRQAPNTLIQTDK
jgi:hypothetical protein